MTVGNTTIGLPPSIKVEKLNHHYRSEELRNVGIIVNEDRWIYSSPRGKIEVVEVLKSSDSVEDKNGNPLPYFSIGCLEGGLFDGVHRINCGELLESQLINLLEPLPTTTQTQTQTQTS